MMSEECKGLEALGMGCIPPIITYNGFFAPALQFFLDALSDSNRTLPLPGKFPAQAQQGDVFAF